MTDKHAFLIIAHTQPNLLKRLLRRLDHRRVDIFIHLDKKSCIGENELLSAVKHSNVFFAERIAAAWGGFSLICAELRLLELSTGCGVYSHYHFLSGQDYLLYSIEKILDYYDHNPGVNYISFKDDERINYLDRIRLFYPLQELVGRNKGLLYYIQRFFVKTQKTLRLYRKIPDAVGFGSAFHDITDDFARWIVRTEQDWRKFFENTVCADELLMQTLFLLYQHENGPDRIRLCEQSDAGNLYLDGKEIIIKRVIDWKRGSPYVWKAEDYDFLMNSKCFYVRKVDENSSRDLLDLLDAASSEE